MEGLKYVCVKFDPFIIMSKDPRNLQMRAPWIIRANIIG